MPLLKLVQHQIRIAAPLPWNVRDEHGKLLLAQGLLVADEAQLDALLQRGAFVDVDEVRAARRAEAAEAQAAAAPATIFSVWEAAIWRLDRLLRSAGLEPGFPERVDEFARHLVALAERDVDIGIFLAVRQDQKRFNIYAQAHALHTAMVCFLMARRIGWDEPRRLTLIKAALTMNIATLDLQGRLAAQGVAPTAKQLEQIRAHPTRGEEILRDAGVADADWLSTVAQHHERSGGSGYPQGLGEVTELACALRHADVFMAKISPRATRSALTTQLAARQLFEEDKGGPMSMAIIKEFGIYPPGNFVQIKSGELAVVVRQGANAKTPVVACITDRHGIPVVTSLRRDTSRPEFAIVATPADKAIALRIPPERLYGLS
jgi:HD-GYP domain-containing protein (c-di-GMP phosphodiesterase class II)